MKKVGRLGGISRETNKDTQIVYHRIHSFGGSSICNSLPYIDSKTAPKGAKLQLYGVCDDEVVVQDLSATTGWVFHVWTLSYLQQYYTSLLSSIGTLRFTLDASFDSNYLIQTISVMRLFDQIVLTSSASSYPNSNGPYLQSPTTFGISNVVVDEGLAYTGLTDCGFSKFKKIVYTTANDVNAIFTFF